MRTATFYSVDRSLFLQIFNACCNAGWKQQRWSRGGDTTALIGSWSRSRWYWWNCCLTESDISAPQQEIWQQPVGLQPSSAHFLLRSRIGAHWEESDCKSWLISRPGRKKCNCKARNFCVFAWGQAWPPSHSRVTSEQRMTSINNKIDFT